MRRATPTMPVSPAMLRHFAAVTVAITVCIGVFAHGENTAAQAEKPKPAAASEEGGGNAMSAMLGGAEQAALKQSQGGKPEKSVGGFRIGSDTHLRDNSSDGGGGGESGPSDSGATGDIRNLDPRNAVVLTPQGSIAAPADQPMQVVKDRSGKTVRYVPAASSKPPKSASPQPPKPPTQTDYERMMAASAQRSGPASSDE